MGEVNIRRATELDVPHIARINAGVFLGDRGDLEGSAEWVSCWLKAFPLYQYFVIEYNNVFAGYAGWQLHGGFHRAEPVIELDQLGIDPSHQGRQLAPQLTKHSMREISQWIKEKNTRIESHITFVVWAYALNFNALSVYAKDFTDGVCGMRTQFGSRAENMLRIRMPIVMPVRS